MTRALSCNLSKKGIRYSTAHDKAHAFTSKRKAFTLYLLFKNIADFFVLFIKEQGNLFMDQRTLSGRRLIFPRNSLSDREVILKYVTGIFISQEGPDRKSNHL